jgi:lysophospholipid acyltransferase (LPLAT)-like uncharacterized protein
LRASEGSSDKGELAAVTQMVEQLEEGDDMKADDNLSLVE